MGKRSHRPLAEVGPLGLLKSSIDALQRNPVILFPTLTLAFIQFLVLELFYFAPRYPLSQFFAPLISQVWSEEFVHYPLDLALLPKMFYYAQIVIYIFVGSYLLGVTACIVAALDRHPKVNVGAAFKEAGNKVIGVVGAKTRRELMLEPQMRLTCHKFAIATEDGSYEKRGTAAQVVKKILDTEAVKLVYAIGAEAMMQEVSVLTAAKSIRMLVQLKPLMLCGSGVCGSCRVNVNGREVLACQEGPEFDGHQVDFNDLRVRMRMLQEPINIPPTVSMDQGGNLNGSWREFFSGILKKLE